MSNLVTRYSIEATLQKGCYHGMGGRFHICQTCADDILAYIRRLDHPHYSGIQPDTKQGAE